MKIKQNKSKLKIRKLHPAFSPIRLQTFQLIYICLYRNKTEWIKNDLQTERKMQIFLVLSAYIKSESAISDVG